MSTRILVTALVIGLAIAGLVLVLTKQPIENVAVFGIVTALIMGGFAAIFAKLAVAESRLSRQQSDEHTITVLEAWESIGHDTGVNPSKEELLDSLRNISRLVEILSSATNPAVNLVLTERIRQIQKHGYDCDHDDENACDEIAALATYYAMPPAARFWSAKSTGYGDTLGEAILPEGWAAKPWDGEERGRIRELEKAGALILAELERLLRAEERDAEPAMAVQS